VISTSGKAHFLDDVPMNRQKRSKLLAPVLNIFLFFCAMEGDRDSEEMEMARKMEIRREMKMGKEM
jgi:hypothetical protein